MKGDKNRRESSGQPSARRTGGRPRKSAPVDSENLPLADARALAHDLSVHKIELEMQNEELRRAQVELEEARAKYFELYHQAPVGYLTLQGAAIIREANRRAFDLLGESEEKLTGKGFRRFLYADDDRNAFYRHWQELMKTGEPQAYDLRLVRRDGSMLWARMTMVLASPALDGSRACHATLSDITVRKEREDSLRLFRTLVDQANDTIEVIDPASGRFLDVNEKVCTSLGYSRDELLKLTIHDIDPLATPEVVAQNMAHLRHSPTLILDSAHRRKDGSTFPVEVNLRLIRLDREYVVAISRDITERKLADEGRRSLVKQLVYSKTRLRALVAEISKTEERGQRRLAAELHDGLAQTLTLIRMSLSRAATVNSLTDVRRLVAEAQSHVDTSIEYTRNLMAQLSPRVLYDFGLPAALAWLGDQLRRHGVTVEITGTPEDFELDEDHAVLAFQCARELLWNVVKHAGVPRAKVVYRLGDGELTIEVSDAGKGFDPKRLEERSSTTDRFGLFSIGERLDLYGGRFDIQSAPGRGTSAKLSMPVVPMRSTPAHPASRTVVVDTPVRGQELRVALVDDHPLLREGLRRTLADHGDLCVVGEAEDGLEAIELARQLKPDVIVMDVNMPRMNGIQATKRIIEELPDTIVVGLSVATDAYIERGMKKAGASGCITKARAGEEVYTAIKKAVEKRRQATVE